MATEVTALGFSIHPEGVDEANKVLDLFAKNSDKAADATERLSERARNSKGRFISAGQGAREGAKGIEELGKRSGQTNGMMLKLAAAAGVVGGAIAGAFSVTAVARAADSWSDLQSRVGAAVKDMSAAPALMKDLVALANATYSPLEATVGAFAGNIGAFRDMGKSADEAMKYTEALNHALVITATKGEQAASVQMHLAKAMDIGKLAGDGLDGVLANGGRVAEALARELGVNVSQLRAMSTQGKITSEVIANALVKDLERLRVEAAAMPATMADGWTRISTGFLSLVGNFDQATGASGKLANALLGFGNVMLSVGDWASRNGDVIIDVFNMITAAVAAAAIVYAGSFIPAVWASVAAIAAQTGAFILMNGGVMGAVAALVAFRGALVATGIGALVVAIGTAIYYFLDLSQKVGGFGKALGLVGDVGQEALKRIGLAGLGLWEGLKGVANGIQGAFLGAFSVIGDAWDVLANGMASTWNILADSSVGSSMGLGVMGRSNVGGSLADGSAKKFEDAASNFKASAEHFAAAGAPMATVDALMKEIAAGAGASAEEVEKLGDNLKNTDLNNLGSGAKRSAKSVSDLAKVLRDLRDELTLLKATQGMSDLEKAIYGKQQEAGVDAGSKPGKLIEETMRNIDAMKRLEAATKSGAGAISDMFTGILSGTQSARGAIAGLIAEMAKVQMQKGILGLANSGGFLGSAFSWLGGMLTPNANGGVYNSAGLSAYSGSVVSSPTIFPFAKGAGLMGEAGPEAILPLSRGADGKLGVKAGGTESGQPVDVHVTVSVDEEGHLNVKAVADRSAARTVSDYDRNILRQRVAQLNQNPRRGG